jgi:hypothetical protein
MHQAVSKKLRGKYGFAGIAVCDRATEPVLLRDWNQDPFHIRNGPSSDEPPVGKVLNTIRHRK